jgi:hypothetical protein
MRSETTAELLGLKVKLFNSYCAELEKKGLIRRVPMREVSVVSKSNHHAILLLDLPAWVPGHLTEEDMLDIEVGPEWRRELEERMGEVDEEEEDDFDLLELMDEDDDSDGSDLLALMDEDDDSDGSDLLALMDEDDTEDEEDDGSDLLELLDEDDAEDEDDGSDHLETSHMAQPIRAPRSRYEARVKR